jgi:protein required for attachment to host cells
MKRTWILAANAARAVCLQRDDRLPDLKFVEEIEDPLGRLKGTDLATDRSGHETTAAGGGGVAFAPRTNPRSKERALFARRLAEFLNDSLAQHKCDALTIVAAHPFLGQIEGHLNPGARKALSATFALDLAGESLEELRRRITEVIAPER